MPVTVINPSYFHHHAKKIDRSDKESLTIENFLRKVNNDGKAYAECGATFPTPGSAFEHDSYVARYSNGFVGSAIEAYKNHHHFIIRPDDVWMAIVSQLGLYVKANPHHFRGIVVDDKEPIVIVDEVKDGKGAIMQHAAQKMDRMIRGSLAQPWFMHKLRPDFSTTTAHDETVCSMLAMASLGNYFTHEIRLASAIPAITLLGDIRDWGKLEQKAENLLRFDLVTEFWYTQLRPVLRGLSTSFTKWSSAPRFWNDFIRHNPGNAGKAHDYLWGWITAFCFFDSNGNHVFNNHDLKWTMKDMHGPDGRTVDYHRVDMNKIPAAYASLPVKIQYNGTTIDSKILAGSVGTRIISSKDVTTELPDGNEGLMPTSAWWVYEVKAVAENQTIANPQSLPFRPAKGK